MCVLEVQVKSSYKLGDALKKAPKAAKKPAAKPKVAKKTPAKVKKTPGKKPAKKTPAKAKKPAAPKVRGQAHQRCGLSGTLRATHRKHIWNAMAVRLKGTLCCKSLLRRAGVHGVGVQRVCRIVCVRDWT
jgi:hypothetical protein